MDINKIYNKCCIKGIKEMQDKDIIPNLIICDPPYEFENKGGGMYSLERTKKIMNKIKDLGTNSFDFDKYIPKILNLQGENINAYFFCNKALLPKYLKIATERNLIFDVLILNKTNPIPAFNNSFMNDVEYIVFMRCKGTYFNSKRGYQNYKKVFNVSIGHSNYVHPNQKPFNLIKKFIFISSPEDALILDCFMGSGTTALASKQLKRNFIGFEISKEYCDIANKRLRQKNLEDFSEV